MRDTIGNNNSDLTEMNRSAVVKILQQREVCSRADIAKQMGLTQASITKIVAALMEMGIVSEVGIMKGNGNRRSIGLKLNTDMHQIIGVKFARHMFGVGVFDISGKIYTQTETEYSIDEDHQSVIAAMKKQIYDMLDQYKNVVAIGLAVPGPYLKDDGHIAVITQMPAWHDINFIEEFKDEFNKPLYIVHDANAGALAEWWFGDHERPIHTLAYFLVGEGVGSGIIENGNLLLGVQGAASEIGHISIDFQGLRCECGNYGCLELYCSAQAMLKKARQHVPECLSESYPKSIEACNVVFEAARGGNQKALEIVKEVAEYIGYGCVTLINAYNPDIIVIGDSVSQGGDLLLPTIMEVVKQRTIPELCDRVQIKISSLKVDPTLYGAAAIATDKVVRMPSAFLAVEK
ncbi:putative NBD/HSP70 family sugar kinase [Mobilisporobacter senegalensis]|uniref:Putative NBD/HSP70 family sugar kinase n=1 Tax=Mobilisporobacter senegalensis TaxID=1329262 RepID=A0A3N1XVL3_9FIRM|nr:ROK family transcriptional regulator [Mobilisporobacter senegalensis]ROR30665.1 putative NBD/HSP70 family sugar kinase [Mobilisporobacter senegalensis]